MTLTVSAADPAVPAGLADLLTDSRGGRGTLLFATPLPEGGEARLVLARDVALDPELAERIKALPGVAEATLSAEDRPALALVS
jgi:DNA polymerase-3 subunit alpha